jgi:hypothetical protein
VAPSPRTRDAGVRRVSRLTRWALAGAVGVSAAVSFVVAKATTSGATSRGSSSAPTPVPGGSSAPVVIGPATGDGAGTGLQPPVTAPVQQSGGGGVATSGGS